MNSLTSLLDARLITIEAEMNTLISTLDALPDTEHANLLVNRLIERIEEQQSELISLYQSYDPVRFKAWRNTK